MRKNAVFIAISLAAVVALYCYSQLMVPLAPIEEMFEVEIEKGASFGSAVGKLDSAGLVKDHHLFTALGRMTGLDKRLIPGYYQFYGKLRPWDVFTMLKEGFVVEWQITVVEGDTLMDIKRKLAAEGTVDKEDFDRLATDGEFLGDFMVNAPSVEGYLFPDTYSISKGTSPEDVLGMMLRRLRAVYDEEMQKRAEEIGFSEREVLTLASIIEKEAILNSERPVISGVYHNRLRRGMPLQADPTAIYGIKPQSAGIFRRDIRRKTDYNTYFIKGLPPGPIASPGLKSIRAALYPAGVPYLYFVANFQGGHTFSVTMDEHRSAIEEYRERKYAAKMAEAESVAPQ
jgi:UPF0755 protein